MKAAGYAPCQEKSRQNRHSHGAVLALSSWARQCACAKLIQASTYVVYIRVVCVVRALGMASFGLKQGDRAFSADPELSKIYTELWKLDENRLKPGEHYCINLQGGKPNNSGTPRIES